ncbi:ComF family protein [Pseudoduganella violacea]|uniref:ComF family protein n=1 Tax=Pseudoduganella violacea TaxID=1715466 RepID=A0A7W5BA19_9BURK|nr:ComF family protein [Pseudoduganella violacea]MBB3119193.1 ComF family protein [Pseudoduganella violacea]
MAGAFLALLLPARCLLCGGRGGDGLCPDCHARFFGGGRPRCCICANPLADEETEAGLGPEDGPAVASTGTDVGTWIEAGAGGGAGLALAPGDRCCGRCRRQRPAYDATVTAADYALPVDRLVLQLKFGARLAHARLFGELLAAAWRASAQPSLPQLLCPVPLGPQRLAERGFNQALEIARPLGRALGVPVRARLMQRRQDTPPQSSLDWGQRAANVARAFTLDSEAALYGRHVGLVDDVMSSGATLHALALACKQAGAARVSNLVFARTPPAAHPY